MSPIRRATNHTFRSLRVRNYRLYFSGQLASLTGTWMQQVGQAWLVLRLTDNSGVALGIVTALQFAPTFLLGMWGGVIADRFDKRRILLVTQVAAAVLAFALGVLTATGSARLWIVYALALLLGLVTVADGPARQAFVTEMVGPEHVPNAVALNTAAFNTGRIAGPAVAAALIYSVGIAWTFLVNGISYLAVVAALLAMDEAALFRRAPAPRARGQVREGLGYAWRSPDLRRTLLLVAVVATFGFNFQVVLPLLATVTFGGGAGTFGLLMSLMSAGAIVGALATAARSRPSGWYVVLAAAAFGALALGVALAPTLLAAAVLLIPTGAASMAFISTANSILQLRSDPFMRGRVMALYTVVLLGGTAVGGPVAGWAAEALGPRASLAIGAAISLLTALAGVAFLAGRRRRIAASAHLAAVLDASLQSGTDDETAAVSAPGA